MKEKCSAFKSVTLKTCHFTGLKIENDVRGQRSKQPSVGAVFSETPPRLPPRVEGFLAGLHRTGDAVDSVSAYITKCHFLGTAQHTVICKQNTKPKACHCSQNTRNFLEGKEKRDRLVF